MRILQDDLVRLTQIGIERRRRLAARIRRERKARREEIASELLTAAGIVSTLAGCFAAETSTRTLIAGVLIGCAMIAAAAAIDIISAQEGARWKDS
jgi:hypothetical protein